MAAFDKIREGLTNLLGSALKVEKGFNIASVDSSAISEIGYDERSSILRIDFQSGATYVFFGVPIDEYIDLMAASSIGQHFVYNIRNDYIFRRLG